MLERDIEKRVNDYATRLGYWQRKFTSPTRRGAPDRIYAIYGRVFFVEFKATGQRPTRLQELEHKKIREAGLTVYVCDNVEDAKAILDREKMENEL